MACGGNRSASWRRGGDAAAPRGAGRRASSGGRRRTTRTGTLVVRPLLTSAEPRVRQEWMRAHYWRMRAYSPYFDTRPRWFRNAWVYQDAYAIYRGRRLGARAPASGSCATAAGAGSTSRRLRAGSCPQYAADIGNPAFRAQWIAGATRQPAPRLHRPVHRRRQHGPRSRTGRDARSAARPAHRPADDARRLAALHGRLHEADPPRRSRATRSCTTRSGSPATRPDRAAPARAADLIEIERGFNDAGLTGGAGASGWELLGFIDRRHADGQGVILDGYARSPAADVRPGVTSSRLIGARRARRAAPAARRTTGGRRATTPTWARRSARATATRRRLAARLRQGRRAAQRARRAHTTGRAPCRRPRPRGRPRSSVTLGPGTAAVLLR